MEKSIQHLGLQLLLCLACLSATAQQPKLEWARRYNGMGSTFDSPAAVAVDAAGNSYVAGTSQAGGIQRMATVKYSPSGEQLWVAQFEGSLIGQELGSSASAIVVDELGGVYVTGSSFIGADTASADYVTVRYAAATGEETWVRHFDGIPGDTDRATAIAVDNSGGVYVTGSSIDRRFRDEFNYRANYITLRYDAATGEQAWVSRYEGPSKIDDGATGIAVDNSGGVYVTGSSSGLGFDLKDYTTVRYAAETGEETWVRHYDGPSGGNDQATAIAVDHSGGVYVTGYSSGSVTGMGDYATVRYDASTGSQTWVSRYDGPSGGNDQATAIAADQQGGVYVTGFSEIEGSGSNYATISYEGATGKQAWLRRYGGAAGSLDRATAIAVDQQGGVYVTGTGLGDYATIRYAASTGGEIWTSRYDGPSSRKDYSRAIAVDNSGIVYVTGVSDGEFGANTAFATISYEASSGAQSWVSRYEGTGSQEDEAIAMAVDAAGNSYVTGASLNESTGWSRIVTIRYSPAGDQVWVRVHEGDFSSTPAAIAADQQGGVYVTGFIRGEAGAEDYLTLRYNALDGALSWESRYDGPAGGGDRASAIVVDDQGGVFVTGSSDGGDTSRDYATLRYDAYTGAQSWASTYDAGNALPGAYRDDEATAIALDKAGGVYVTGYSRGLANDFATLRYEASTGERTWVSRYDGGESEDQVWAIAADDAGGVYVTGYSLGYNTIDDLDFVTLGYVAATGAQRWASRYDGGSNDYDEARAIAVDSEGGVYVAGHSFGQNMAPALVTFRYDAATGARVWMSRHETAGGEARAIAIDTRGGVYVTGSGFSTRKYSAADGALVWEEEAEPGKVLAAMALDAAGNVYLTGSSLGVSTGSDFLTLKYSQQGQCPGLAESAIMGSATSAVNSTGSAYTLSASGASSFDWSITGPDGSAYTNFTGQGTGSVAVDWPAEPNVYKVSVTYSANAGCPSRTAVTYVHVFDPKAGFVSSGGWSDSPQHPDYELMREDGKVYWAFVAKYKRGDADRVQGTAALLLESSLSAFRSTSVEDGSLVIAGERAFFRGTGTLARHGGSGIVTDGRRFGFLVAATDGQLGSRNGPDRLRLKIWVIQNDGTQGEVVYDSQVACPSANLDNNAEACAAIDKGSVIIHRPNALSLYSLFLQTAAETTGSKRLRAYPTAFSDRTTLAFAAGSDTGYTLELYDLKGALVRRVAAGTVEAGRRYEHEVRAEGMANGVYLARLTTGEGVQTVKLILQR